MQIPCLHKAVPRYVPLMVRPFLIILTGLLGSCTTGQKPKDTPGSDTTVAVKIETSNKHNFNLPSSRKCEQTRLSNQFDIEINLRRYSDTTEHHDSCFLKVLIKEKQTKAIVDSMFITSLFYFDDTFANCDSVMSFTTKYNSTRQAVDNYFGDIVVADLNFDNKDDIAIINDYGGNGGTFYSYFMQGKDKKFTLDSFLTDSVTYFPSVIDKTKQRITTYVHAGACCVGEQIYKYDKSKKEWRLIKHRILGKKAAHNRVFAIWR
jgi:hypothetical protein